MVLKIRQDETHGGDNARIEDVFVHLGWKNHIIPEISNFHKPSCWDEG